MNFFLLELWKYSASQIIDDRGVNVEGITWGESLRIEKDIMVRYGQEMRMRAWKVGRMLNSVERGYVRETLEEDWQVEEYTTGKLTGRV